MGTGAMLRSCWGSAASCEEEEEASGQAEQGPCVSPPSPLGLREPLEAVALRQTARPGKHHGTRNSFLAVPQTHASTGQRFPAQKLAAGTHRAALPSPDAPSHGWTRHHEARCRGPAPDRAAEPQGGGTHPPAAPKPPGLPEPESFKQRLPLERGITTPHGRFTRPQTNPARSLLESDGFAVPPGCKTGNLLQKVDFDARRINPGDCTRPPCKKPSALWRGESNKGCVKKRSRQDTNHSASNWAAALKPCKSAGSLIQGQEARS